MDCGSLVVQEDIDDVAPVFRMNRIYYSCGAVMTSIKGAHGQVGRVIHEGCGSDLQMECR